MSAASAARQQRALLELLKLPGNEACADCKASLPRWASANLGIFICERCAGVHRKLGSHITKVKSLTHDNWDKAGVERMRAIGNARSNEALNPRNERPKDSLDPDDSGRALEAFLRSKYEKRELAAKVNGDDLMSTDPLL